MVNASNYTILDGASPPEPKAPLWGWRRRCEVDIVNLKSSITLLNISDPGCPGGLPHLKLYAAEI